MTYRFGRTSRERLADVHPTIIMAAELVLEHMDITVQQHGGHRTAQVQNLLFQRGVSTKDGFQDLSMHQAMPSLAADFAPYPTPWEWDPDNPKDFARWYYMGGLFMMAAKVLEVKLRWLGDQDGDGLFTDQSFDDLGHIELIL